MATEPVKALTPEETNVTKVQGDVIAGEGARAVIPNNAFVFFATFDGTNNIKDNPAYSNDKYSTAVGLLSDRVKEGSIDNPNVTAKYYNMKHVCLNSISTRLVFYKGQYLLIFARTVLLLFVANILCSGFVFAEDPLQVRLQNPIKYATNEYKDKYGLNIKSTLEIEKADQYTIKFNLETITPNLYVCNLSGTAYSTPENSLKYAFIYDDCKLYLIMSGDAQSITSSDMLRTCPKYFCGYSGIIDGFVFKKIK